MLDLQKMIIESMKAHDSIRTNAYKNIKARKQELLTADLKIRKPYDEMAEIAMIRKMVKELQDDYDVAINAGRTELAENALAELNIIKELLPKEASSEDIQKIIDEWVSNNGKPEKRQMGVLINEVKSKLPSAEGSLVAKLVKNTIG